jgi:hypothetical protein
LTKKDEEKEEQALDYKKDTNVPLNRNPHDEIKGSRSSPGAYYEGIKKYYKADESKNSPKLGLECTNFNNGQSSILCLIV